MKRSAVVAAACLAVLPHAARAETPCADAGQPYVRVSVASSEASDDLATRVVSQLRAGLRSRKIAVCDEKSPSIPKEAPIAVITLEPAAESKVVITVEIADAITNKKVSRDIDLSNEPRDTWPLSLALAADEVLRASWAELALANAPPPARPVPEPVRETVRESLGPSEPLPSAKHLALGAALAFELYAAGQRQIGIDARAELWLTRRFFAQALAGLRSAAEVESDHGKIRSRALVFGAGLGLTLTDPDASIGTDAIVRMKLTEVRFEGESSGDARERRAWLTAVNTEAALAAWLMPASSLRLALEIGGGVPIRSATARDNTSVVTGIDGASFALALCFGGVF